LLLSSSCPAPVSRVAAISPPSSPAAVQAANGAIGEKGRQSGDTTEEWAVVIAVMGSGVFNVKVLSFSSSSRKEVRWRRVFPSVDAAGAAATTTEGAGEGVLFFRDMLPAGTNEGERKMTWHL